MIFGYKFTLISCIVGFSSRVRVTFLLFFGGVTLRVMFLFWVFGLVWLWALVWPSFQNTCWFLAVN